MQTVETHGNLNIAQLVIKRAYRAGEGEDSVGICYSFYKNGVCIVVKAEALQRLEIKFNGYFPHIVFENNYFSRRYIRSFWSLNKGFHPRNKHDPFAMIYKEIAESIAKLVCYKRHSWLERFNYHFYTSERWSFSEILRECFADVKKASIFAAEQLLDLHRRYALKFSSNTRLGVYYLLLSDKSGRLMQLADAYPGVLIFAVALARQKSIGKKIAQKLIQDIVFGKKLNQCIDDAIHAKTKVYSLLLEEPINNKSPLVEQRIFIKKAKSRVTPTALLLPPPLKFAPEDIPQTVQENARWYKTMRKSAKLFSDDVPEETQLRIALSACLSKNHQHIRKTTSVNQLFDYLQYAGIKPDRNSNIPRLLKQSRQWHRVIRRMPLVVHYCDKFSYCLPEFDAPDISIKPITTAEALIQEGMEMSHCVASCITFACQGRRAYAHAVIANETLTVEAFVNSHLFSLGEVKGKCNKLPSQSAIRVLRGWLDSLNKQKITQQKLLQ